nr:VWA domain-containing protein [Flavobacterium rivuli]
MWIADVPNTQQGYLSDVDKEVENQIGKGAVVAGRPNATFVKTLQGEAQGLNISTVAGAPGSNSKISIRGVSSIQTGNEPLYVIDGVPANANAFRKIDANNIESISVLKDANAISLYGNRGVNGVVIIKTKKLTRKQIRELKKAIKEDKEAGYIDNATGQFVPIDKIKIDQEEYESFEENKFENPATAPLSTFSIDVDNASYTNIRRFINNGQTVPKDAVRVEEMINFFKYSYPQPTGNDPFSINTEYSDAPWNPKHKLLKIGLQGREIATKDLPASNFVFLIDVSGSMNDANKLPLLKQSMKILVNQMRPIDRIAIVVYAGAAGLVLPSTSIADKDKIIASLDNLNAGGSTAGGEGIELAYKTAQDNFIRDGNNRVILATDGDFNVGASTDDDMQTLIEAKRKSGVFLTCLGYGMGNYKDSKLETLADKGNGNYAYIDNMQEAGRFLDKEFIGSMYAIAKDVKIQIEFNPKHVQSYRLIGYENRKLRDEDFANDTVDAGELGSGHTVTALYEIIPTGVQSDYFAPNAELKYSQVRAATGNYSDELATIKFRHKKPDEDKSTEIIKTIPNSIVAPDRTSADFKFAAAVAWFGLKLRDSKLIPAKQPAAIKELAKQGLLYDPEGYKAEFIRLVDRVE